MLHCSHKSRLTLAFYHCAGRSCVNTFQGNQPTDFKSATGTVNQESDLLSCGISLRVCVLIWQMNCSSFRSRFRLTVLFLAHIYTIDLHLETVDGMKDIKTPIIVIVLRMTWPVQGATVCSILDFCWAGPTSQRTIPKI